MNPTREMVQALNRKANEHYLKGNINQAKRYWDMAKSLERQLEDKNNGQ